MKGMFGSGRAVLRSFVLTFVLVLVSTSPVGAQDQGLVFPFSNLNYLDYYYCYGIYPWNPGCYEEVKCSAPNYCYTHGGIDLVAWYSPLYPIPILVPVVASANAKVAAIIEGSSDGLKNLVVVLEMNSYWFIVYSFKPESADEEVFYLQKSKILVKPGQTVVKGQKIGDLVVWKVQSGGYAHVHYGFFYKNPGDLLEYIYENHNCMIFSDGTNLPPVTGPGSPWDPQEFPDLGTTFYCPYEYSNNSAKSIYKSWPKRAGNGDWCKHVCAYGSQDGDCGDAGPI